MPTDTYAEQRPGTAVVVVGYFAHCLIVIHGHPAINTKQASCQKRTVQLPMGCTHRRALLFLEMFLCGRTKALACSRVFAVWLVLDFAKKSEKHRPWINVTGSVQKEICP